MRVCGGKWASLLELSCNTTLSIRFRRCMFGILRKPSESWPSLIQCRGSMNRLRRLLPNDLDKKSKVTRLGK